MQKPSIGSMNKADLISVIKGGDRMKKDERAELESQLITLYEHWEDLHDNGGHDPLYADGVNLNLVRNNILYYRDQLKELDYFPEIMERPVPTEMENTYMARAEEIRANAKNTLQNYKQDEDYKYLCRHSSEVSMRDAENICLRSILNYVEGLEKAIHEDDLVAMRRHESPDRYKESFKTCREQMEKTLRGRINREGQLDIFDFFKEV